MGSNQSVGIQQVDINICHPKFKIAKISRINQKAKLICQLSIQQSKFKNWQKILSCHHSLNRQFLLLPQNSQYNHQKFCSTYGTLKIMYQNFPYLLKSEINDRIGKKQFFTQQQIWYLMFAIFSAKKQFIDQNINSGILSDVTPQNIFLSQRGQIKIGNILSWPNLQQLDQNKKIVSLNSSRYLAPEDFLQLSLGMSYCKMTNQSQIFSIGLTLLSTAILKDNTELYNLENKKFNFNQTLSRLKLLNSIQRYSDLLKAFIQLLCAIQPKQRLKINQINEILFKSQNSIRSRKKFTIYPVSKRIDDKIRQNRKNKISINNISPRNINKPEISILPKNINEKIFQQIAKQQQSILHKSINSPRNISIKMANGIQNSLNLTQVILAPPRNYSNDIISQNSNNQSIFSSIDNGVKFKKTTSESHQNVQNVQIKHLQRYQQINANTNQNNESSLSQSDFLNLVNFSKEIIIQKPVVIDTKRKSDDIQEQMTPVQTPHETPFNRSQVKGQQKTGFNRNFYIPDKMLQQKENSSKQLSKTTTIVINNSLHPQSNIKPIGNNSADSPNKLRVKQSKSQDPSPSFDNTGRQQISKTMNSTITMYIPMVDGESIHQSSRGSWQSPQKKSSQNQSNKQMARIPQVSIQQRSKQCSQIQISQLTEQDKQRIQEEMINKIQKLINKAGVKDNGKRFVRFAENQQILDMSHESKVLEIDDIDLECLQQDNDYPHLNTDKILVEYRQPNQSQIVIESVKISK